MAGQHAWNGKRMFPAKSVEPEGIPDLGNNFGRSAVERMSDGNAGEYLRIVFESARVDPGCGWDPDHSFGKSGRVIGERVNFGDLPKILIEEKIHANGLEPGSPGGPGGGTSAGAEDHESRARSCHAKFRGSLARKNRSI